MKQLITILLLVANMKGICQQPLVTQIDSVIRYYDRIHKFHGAVLVAKNGQVILDKGYGQAEPGKQLSNSHVFQIGSVTKQFTAAAILKLQEEGKLTVEDKVSKYFPQLSYGDRITIHQLLTHTSGIFNYTNDTAFWLSESRLPSTQEKMIARFADKPLDFEPGQRYSYSNSGYVLLGYIIEKVSGKSYEQFIRQNIFQPLQMDHSGFDFTKASSRAKGYYDNGSIMSEALIVDSTGSYAAGAIYSTTGDLYKWSQAMHEKKLLRPESWQKAFTPFKSGYGYGLLIDKVYNAPRIWHNGGIHGFVSHLEYFPDSNMVVILLSNYMESDLVKLSNNINAVLFGKPYELPKERIEIKLPASVLDQYVGVYQLTPAFAITITKEGDKLMAQATGQNSHQVYPESADFFFYKVVDAQLEFKRDEKGQVETLVLHQNGMKVPGKRKK
jgi:CubicO group peptidase (beta-lactamase class C family)